VQVARVAQEVEEQRQGARLVRVRFRVRVRVRVRIRVSVSL